jgi:hypothetical protein
MKVYLNDFDVWAVGLRLHVSVRWWLAQALPKALRYRRVRLKVNVKALIDFKFKNERANETISACLLYCI